MLTGFLRFNFLFLSSWQCAYGLVRFRQRNNLVRVRKRSSSDPAGSVQWNFSRQKKNLVFCCKFPKHPKTENDNCSVQLSHHCHLLLTGKSARLPETGMWYDMFFLETSSSHENSTYWWFAETYNANTLFCRLEHHTGIEKKGKNWVETMFFCFRAIS